jgi:undecaprenyl-phosphate 4-deoxy-4-formamido-L-arabinose transferase
VVDAMNQTEDPTIFINALAQKFAGRATDIEVRHEARHAGQSRYGVFQLVRLFFDLITGFSLVPVQVFTATGFLASFLSLALVVVLLVRRIVVGPEAEGVFTLFALLFLLVSVVMVGIGLVGEYVGRIYLAVARRPRYLVREMIGYGKKK